MPVTRAAFSDLLAPDIRRILMETGKERPMEFESWCNVQDMEWNPETDAQYSGLGTLGSKPEGAQFPLDEPLRGGTKSYEAEAFALAFEVTWEMYRDELYGVIRNMAKELGRSSRNRIEVSAHSILNNAFNDAFPGFDGVALCHVAHPDLDGNTKANRPSVNVEFSMTALQNGVEAFEAMTGARGLPWLMAPQLVMVTPAYKWTARMILGSTGHPFTSDNELNPIMAEDLSWMVSHYLTTETFWFMMTAKGIHDLNFRWRDKPISDSFDDPWTKNAIYTIYQRHTQGFGSWRGIYGSSGA